MHISLAWDICSRVGETHFTRDVCFLSSSGMCFPGKEHVSLVISVPLRDDMAILSLTKFSLMFCNVLVDARVSSAGQQRPPMPGVTTQGVPIRPTRHRKVSRSAGPSVAALRKALMISGGECDFNLLV